MTTVIIDPSYIESRVEDEGVISINAFNDLNSFARDVAISLLKKANIIIKPLAKNFFYFTDGAKVFYLEIQCDYSYFIHSLNRPNIRTGNSKCIDSGNCKASIVALRAIKVMREHSNGCASQFLNFDEFCQNNYYSKDSILVKVNEEFSSLTG